MSAILVADHLSKWYGPRLAVDDVSFEVQKGEVVGLLGPNGSGKSTILRILTGYLRPSGGTARIGGFDVLTHGLEARLRVGYVPEDVPLYTHMRVTEFLSFMGRLRGLDGERLRNAVASACERVSLQAVRDLLIAKLSRGFRQRVAIAQALVGDPDLLILDEPTNGLDPRQIIELRGLIRALASSCAVLVTSHVLDEIERVANRAAILLNGRLLAVHPIRGEAAVRSLRLRLHGSSDEFIAACMDSVAGVTSTALDSRAEEISTWRVGVDHETVAERLSARLIAAGVGVREITRAASDLETVFLRLTNQGAQA